MFKINNLIEQLEKDIILIENPKDKVYIHKYKLKIACDGQQVSKKVFEKDYILLEKSEVDVYIENRKQEIKNNIRERIKNKHSSVETTNVPTEAKTE